MVLRNVENKIKLVLIVCSLFLLGCVIISLGSIFVARGMVSDASKKIYVLDGTVPVLVNRTDMDETFDVEAKSHVEMFHNLFFTLSPDESFIKSQMDKAMYLVDESGMAQYNTLREKGLYRNIMGTSSVMNIMCDSVLLDHETRTFTYYGRQRIERRTSILFRQLVTTGELKKVSRSDHNPHGILIMNWRTLLNKDLEERAKRDYFN